MAITIDNNAITPSQGAVIKVIGVGGAGGNAVNTMIDSGLSGVDFIAVNTDIQALNINKADVHVQIGKKATEGLGAGADPNIGETSVLEDSDLIKDAIGKPHMVFVTAGMGGGTGTGAAPVVAKMAMETKALTVAIVTKPFKFEGNKRMASAERGIDELRKNVDTLIVIPNQRLMEISKGSLTLQEAFTMADNVLLQATKGISDIIKGAGYINVDFADVKSIMTTSGDAIMGIGEASGEGRATAAADKAISSPLLEEYSLKGAKGILINITSSSNILMSEIDEATEYIRSKTQTDDANVIFGVVIDESLEEKIQITVIATGFNDQAQFDEKMQPTKRNFRQFDEIPAHSPQRNTIVHKLCGEERSSINYDSKIGSASANYNQTSEGSNSLYPINYRRGISAIPSSGLDKENLNQPTFLRNRL